MAKWTRQAILNTFESLLEEKNFDKITVVELVERCGVNRNTFYYYFQDIYALLEAWLEQNRVKTEKYLMEDMKLEDVFLHALRFTQRSKNVIYHIHRSTSHATLMKYLGNETYKLTVAYIERQAVGFQVDPKDLQALTIFYTSAISGILYRWLNEEMKFDLEPFIRRISGILEGNIEQLLQKLAEEDK